MFGSIDYLPTARGVECRKSGFSSAGEHALPVVEVVLPVRFVATPAGVGVEFLLSCMLRHQNEKTEPLKRVDRQTVDARHLRVLCHCRDQTDRLFRFDSGPEQ